MVASECQPAVSWAGPKTLVLQSITPSQDLCRQRFNRLERQQINYNKKQVCYQTTYVEPPLRQNHLSQPPSEFMGASESGTSVTRDKLVKTRRSQHDGRLWIQVYPGVVLEDGNADKDAEKLRQARTFMSSRRNLLQICGLYGFLYSCFIKRMYLIRPVSLPMCMGFSQLLVASL
ncbi:hypothetical protein EV363DRAFT_870139 [Boletus edulis]|nr:hypothetical protein EV363DRAFT_870139 [Boletus edulis]